MAEPLKMRGEAAINSAIARTVPKGKQAVLIIGPHQ